MAATDPAALEGFERSADFGWLLLKTTLILAAVCLLAYLVIRFLLRRHGRWAQGSDQSGGLTRLARLGLSPRQSVQVVRAGSKVLLIGVTDRQISPLCELDGAEWEKQDRSEEAE